MNLVSRTLLGALWAVFLAPDASAGGMDLRWDDCGAFGFHAKNFACNSNVATNSIFGAAVAPAPVAGLQAMSADLVLTADQSTIPPWWSFDDGCRSGPPSALTTDFNFVSGPYNCYDPWVGMASGGASYVSGSPSPNQARLQISCSTPSPQPLDAQSEYYLFKITIASVKTTGAGSCVGCEDGVCINLRSIHLIDASGSGSTTITQRLLDNRVAWQETQIVFSPDCPNATPTRNTTWGAVKSLYR